MKMIETENDMWNMSVSYPINYQFNCKINFLNF